jgi:hypothetical protein
MTRRTWLWVTGVAALALFAVLAVIDRKLADTGGPGIVPFELAGTRDRAQEILSDWGAKGRDDARLSLWLDYAYIVAYATFFALAVAALRDMARDRGWRRFARAGAVIVAFPIAAGVCDAFENAFLLLVVGGHEGLAPAATTFALAKFALSITSTVYILASLVRRWVARSGDRKRPVA